MERINILKIYMLKKTSQIKSSNKKLPKRILDELRKAEELKLEGEYEGAVLVLEKILVDDPGCLEILEELADNLLSLDEFEKAEKVANFIITLDKKSFVANHVIGFLHLHNNKWREAIVNLKIANESNPNNAEILRCLGWGLYNANKKMEGIVTLERALNLNEENSMILCDLGVCLLQEDSISQAKTLFEKAALLDLDNERVRECLSLAQKIEKESGK